LILQKVLCLIQEKTFSRRFIFNLINIPGKKFDAAVKAVGVSQVDFLV